jgi:hypothetical protein
VRNAVGLANYLPKHVKDRSKVEMPPPMWRGRRCRLVWRSKGFLTKSKDRLWQEQRAEWYPQPVAADVVPDEKNRTDGVVAAKNMVAIRPMSFWRERQEVCHPNSLRLLVAVPVDFEGCQPLDAVRAVQTARGP